MLISSHRPIDMPTRTEQACSPAPSEQNAGPDDTFKRSENLETLPSWRFAWKYDSQEILSDGQKAQEFLGDYLKHEADFFKLARDPESGLTFDGINLDPQTGEMTGVRGWSAASKECLDLGMCVKALYGDPLVAQVVSPEDPSKAPEVAAEILSKKIASYQQYQEEFPGFQGFMTWFDSGSKAIPTGEWEKAIPTLDLGEMLIVLMLAEKALRDTGHKELAKSYQTYNDQLQASARDAMFEPNSQRIRGHVVVEDPKDPNSKFAGTGIMTGEHGLHEGQMVILYMTLFGGLPEQVNDAIWDDIQLKRVEHRYGTTWEGFWASPHEHWGHLFLPYKDHEGFDDLFRIREKIRAQNAVDRDYPGFAASAHHPNGDRYMSAAGIEGVASQPLEFQDTYTPYGAFPMLLQFAGELTGNVGLAWLHNMLSGPKMQGPLGAGESGDNAGTAAAPVKTIDVTFCNLLALAGGLERETAELFKEKGVYDTFLNRMDSEFQETFGDRPLREPIGFAPPGKPAPVGAREYEWNLASA